MMNQTEQRVTLSDYLLSRRFNAKLYNRLRDKLEAIVEEHNESFPDLQMEIGMSAKYQTPYISLSTEEDVNYLGGVIRDIDEALDEVGFTFEEEEDKHGKVYVNFTDM